MALFIAHGNIGTPKRIIINIYRRKSHGVGIEVHRIVKIQTSKPDVIVFLGKNSRLNAQAKEHKVVPLKHGNKNENLYRGDVASCRFYTRN